MADQITHTLKHPITVTRGSGDNATEEQIKEVTITPITKAKHLRGLDLETGEMAKGIRMVAIATKLPIAAVDEMHLEDFTALTGIIEDFLPDGLVTGPSS